MFIATVVFWMGRNKFVHIQPRGVSFFKETFTGEGLRVILKLIPVYLFIAVFWSLYDQTGKRLGPPDDQDGSIDLRDRTAAQPDPGDQSAPDPVLHPALDLRRLPAHQQGVPADPDPEDLDRVLRHRRRLRSLLGLIESWIDNGLTPNIGWQLLAYVIITAAEVMVSITGLEFSYRQAPPQMKSFVMSLFLLTVAVGNVFTGQVNTIIQIPEQADAVVAEQDKAKLEGAAARIEAAWRESGAADRLLRTSRRGRRSSTEPIPDCGTRSSTARPSRSPTPGPTAISTPATTFATAPWPCRSR